MRFILCLFFLVSLVFSGTKELIESFEKMGYSNIKQLPSVPKSIQGTMIAVFTMNSDGKNNSNPMGERIGKVYEDYVEMSGSYFPVFYSFIGEDSKGWGIILMGENYMLTFKAAPEGLSNMGRFAMEFFVLSTRKSVTALLK